MALLTPGLGIWDLRQVREDFLSTVPNNVRQVHALGVEPENYTQDKERVLQQYKSGNCYT